MAATAPPAPLPTTSALATAQTSADLRHRLFETTADERRRGVHGIRTVGGTDLLRRVPARLGVPRKLDVLPSHEPLVPAVLGVRVHALDRVLEDQGPERGLREDPVLFRGR